MPNIENALSRLAMLDKQPNLNKNSVIAPPDLFTPRGPRLGTSGHVGIAPAPPLKSVVSKKKSKASAADDDDEEGAELLDDVDEPSRGNSEFEGSSDSSDDLLYSAPAPMPRSKKAARAVSSEDPDEPNMSEYEARMRRLLHKDKGDFLPPALTTWTGSCTEAQVHDYQQTLAWLRVAATTGAGTAQNAVRQLSIHTIPDGNINDNYVKSARAYYGLMEFADCDVFDRVLAGAYKLKVKE